MKSLKKAKLKGKTVIVRTDFNVPIKNGKVVDDSRIRAALPTIRFLLKKAAKVVIVTHLGRPKGVDESLRLDPVAQKLADLLDTTVMKYDCIPCEIDHKLSMLENIRFFDGEEKNSAKFAKLLASLGDVYVNEAFSDCHRKHASICAITRFLPSYPGFLLETEIAELSRLKKPVRPFIAVLGGAKLETKIPVIKSLKADAVLLGGAMPFTFLKELGFEVGRSKVEDIRVINLLKKGKIILPVDFVCGKQDGSVARICDYRKMPKNLAGLDIGPETSRLYSEMIRKAKTVFWNGPVGLFEVKQFEQGTKCIAKSIAANKAFTVVGGGDTIRAIDKFHISGFSFVSTGGGASLAFLASEKLPGLEALK